MELERKDKRTGKTVLVEWSDLGEGICGDWNPDDPDDIALLRFDISVIEDGDDMPTPISDASYCTQVPADTDPKILKKGLEMIMDEIFDAVIEEESIKKPCERMSWISPETIEKGVWGTRWVLG